MNTRERAFSDCDYIRLKPEYSYCIYVVAILELLIRLLIINFVDWIVVITGHNRSLCLSRFMHTVS